jgi:hypothetical protein
MYFDATSVEHSIDYVGIDIDKFNKKEQSGWLDRLRNIKVSKFTFPTNELMIKLDANSSESSSAVSTFRMPNIDDYRLFCVEQVLSINQLTYYYSRVDENLLLSLKTADETLIRKIFREFGEYGIEGN